jgi:hypothetical protein
MAMTDAEKLNKLMTMLDDDVSTNVANTFLEAAEKAVINLAFPFGDGTEVMPEKYEEVQIEIAAYLINKRGAEGEVSHSEGGVSRTYESADIPLALRTRITPKAGGF